MCGLLVVAGGCQSVNASPWRSAALDAIRTLSSRLGSQRLSHHTDVRYGGFRGSRGCVMQVSTAVTDG
jgi:hypothetical protein